MESICEAVKSLFGSVTAIVSVTALVSTAIDFSSNEVSSIPQPPSKKEMIKTESVWFILIK